MTLRKYLALAVVALGLGCAKKEKAGEKDEAPVVAANLAPAEEAPPAEAPVDPKAWLKGGARPGAAAIELDEEQGAFADEDFVDEEGVDPEGEPPADEAPAPTEAPAPPAEEPAPRADAQRTVRLYVGNLSFNTTGDTIREEFSSLGEVVDVHVVMDRDTGQPRGFAFVTMGSPAEAAKAINEMNGKTIDGRPLRVNEAEERMPRGGSGGGGRGGGGGGRGGGGRGGGGGGRF